MCWVPKKILLYKKYPSGKLNKDAFKFCVSCYKKQRKSESEKENTGASNASSSEAGAVMSFLCGVEMSGKEDTNACDQVTKQQSVFVTVSISSDAHSKFQKCKISSVFRPVSTTALLGKNCSIGPEMLSKLECGKSMIVKDRIFVKIMAAGTFVERALHVDTSVKELHLDEDTI